MQPSRGKTCSSQKLFDVRAPSKSTVRVKRPWLNVSIAESFCCSTSRRAKAMIVVGLTGGIATGKSSVTALLRHHGLTVLDCDEIAHAVVRQGSWGYRRVVRAFGTDILSADGKINRGKLGDLVFEDHAARKKLTAATHLPIALELFRQLAVEWLSLTNLIVVDMPLLFESGAHRFLWPKVTVTCNQDMEVERLVQRDKCTVLQAERKVAAQMPLQAKQAKSQIVLDNSGSRVQCEQQVQQLVRQLEGKLKLLGVATSPVVMVGLTWVLLKYAGWR